MKTFEKASIVSALANALRKRGSWAGETHIQKAMYFLQQMLEVPTDFEFVLYKHGPFSFDLRETLTLMEAEDLIRWQPHQYPYGPSMQPGPDHEYLDRHFGGFVEPYLPQIGFVADRLAARGVKELERLATALYVTHEGGETSKRAERIHELKPHVTLAEADKAIEDLDSMIAEVKKQANLQQPIARHA